MNPLTRTPLLLLSNIINHTMLQLMIIAQQTIFLQNQTCILRTSKGLCKKYSAIYSLSNVNSSSMYAIVLHTNRQSARECYLPVVISYTNFTVIDQKYDRCNPPIAKKSILMMYITYSPSIFLIRPTYLTESLSS